MTLYVRGWNTLTKPEVEFLIHSFPEVVHVRPLPPGRPHQLWWLHGSWLLCCKEPSAVWNCRALRVWSERDLFLYSAIGWFSLLTEQTYVIDNSGVNLEVNCKLHYKGTSPLQDGCWNRERGEFAGEGGQARLGSTWAHRAQEDPVWQACRVSGRESKRRKSTPHLQYFPSVLCTRPLEIPADARKLADEKNFEVKGYRFGAAPEQSRPPRTVRIALVQNAIVRPTTDPIEEQVCVSVCLSQHILVFSSPVHI